jgi:hypothetical protein
MSTWAVQDSSGQIVEDLLCASRLDVARKLMPVRYDAFRLRVSSSYRELFERALKQPLEREGWRIVRVSRRETGTRAENHTFAGNAGAAAAIHATAHAVDHVS